MKSAISFVLILTYCANLAQSQFNLRGGTPVNIQWNNIRGVQVPRRVQVILTAANTGFRRTNFPTNRAIENRMNQMNRRPNDEKGHIIASQLGGVVELWNLFPQTPNMNRNAGNRHILISWYELENRIAGFLRGQHNRIVNYQIDFSYNSPQEPARPSHVRVVADFFENNRRVDRYEAPMRNGDAIFGVPRVNRRRRPVG